MPQASVLCAGSCGRMIIGGGVGSLPAGRRMCRDCRSRRPSLLFRKRPSGSWEATIKVGQRRSTRAFPTKDEAESAGEEALRRARDGHWPAFVGRRCDDCGTELPTDTGPGPRWCADCRTLRSKDRNRRKNVNRRGVRHGTRYTLKQVGDRCGWRCHICRRKVDPLLSGMNPQGPTIDHLIPVCDDGDDTLDNVDLAHRECNLRRGKGTIPAQLRLNVA